MSKNSKFNDFLSIKGKKPSIASGDKERYLLFDFSQFVYTSKFLVTKKLQENLPMEECVDFYKHLILNSLISVVKQLYPIRRVIIAADKSSWRRAKFGGVYKASRRKKRDDDGFDWKGFFGKMEEFKTELKEHFPFLVVENYNCEGDDVIAALAKHLVEIYPTCEPVIVSSDKDMMQLLTDERIRIWDPKKKIYKEPPVTGVKNLLLSHILLGDKSDGVPSIVKPIDHYMNPNSEKISDKRLGKKTVAKHITDNTVFSDIIGDDEVLKRRFDENRELIDLNYIPKDLTAKIVEVFNAENESIKTRSINDLMMYLSQNNMRNLLNQLSDFEKIFDKI